MDSFQTLWQRFHPDAVPVGHTLEKNGTWNLTRFHLLPNGRDGTVSRQEYRQLIQRFNQLAGDVLDEGAPVWLILPEISAPDWAPPAPVDRRQQNRLYRLKRRFGLTKAWEYYSADDKAVIPSAPASSPGRKAVRPACSSMSITSASRTSC